MSSGGILQLVAKGPEDLFISNDPQITFFKTVFRRHTNFSRGEYDLTFSGRLDFGKKTTCKIQRWGDLLHRLFLVINLPDIDIKYKALTVWEVQELLKECGVKWRTTKSHSDMFDQSDFDAVCQIINNRMDELDQHTDKIIEMLEAGDNIIDNELDCEKYWEQLYNKVFSDDPVYQFLYTCFKDIVNKEKAQQIYNLADIKKLVFDKIAEYVIKDDNLLFLCKVDKAYYGNGNNGKAIFTQAIHNTSSSYKDLDAYKIFCYYLDTTSPIINSKFDVEIVKLQVINNIRLGIECNILLLKNIFNSLINNAKFTFYKTFTKEQLGYDKSANFNSLSLINQNINTFTPRLTSGFTDILDDNFTKDFNSLNKNVTSPLNDYIQDSVNNFNVENRDIFRNESINEYFNYFKLWERTNIKKNNIYFLNYIPILTNQDIPEVIKQVINTIKDDNPNMVASIETFENDLNNAFDSKRIDVHAKLVAKICNDNNDNIINTLDTFKNNDDIMMVSVLTNGECVVMPKYVIQEYLNIIDQFSSISGFGDIKSELEKAINLFRTEKEMLPDFNTFKNVLYGNLREDIIINGPVNMYSDAISSIWYNLVNDYIDNYNSLYNDKLLNTSVYEEKFGTSISANLKRAKELLDVENFYIDASKENNQVKLSGDICNYLNDALEMYKEQLKHYDENLKYLNISSVLNNYNTDSNKYKDIINYIENNTIVELSSEIKDIFDTLKQDARHTIVDIVVDIGDKFDEFMDNIDNNDPCNDRLGDKGREILDCIRTLGGENCPCDVQKIIGNLNNLETESELYELMIDIFIAKTLNHELVLLKRKSIKNNYSASEINKSLMEYLGEKLKEYEKENELLEDKKETLMDILEKSLRNCEPANFAWIRRLGHYIIKEIGIKIGDQCIDTHYGEWLEIWHSLIKRDQKERGYDILIGDVPELTTFNTEKKRKYKMVIPLQFWFCRYIGAALPMIALQHTEVELFVKLREFEEVAYFDKCTKFRKKPRLDGKIIAEYIYVEHEERDMIAKARHEYLIEVLQFSGYQEYNKDNLDSLDVMDGECNECNEIMDSDTNVGCCINVQLQFKHPIKEVVWFLQRLDFIDGSRENCERKWNNYGYDFDTGDINMIDQASILFEGRVREHYKDIVVYNFVYPYERHYSDPSTGINLYSYSLDPEMYQPSGAVNMSRLTDSGINMILKDITIDGLVNDNIMIRFGAYGLGYNILRIMSGLAGLSFIK